MAWVPRYQYINDSASFDYRINHITASGGGSSSINTGSFVTTSSFNLFTSSYNTGSFTGSFTGSLLGTASYVLSASYALSSSYSLTASYALNANAFPYTGSALITGSLGITGSLELRSGSNFIIENGLISSSYNTNNVSIGGTPSWTSALRNVSIGILNQSSVTTQTDNTSVGYQSLKGGNYNTAVGAYSFLNHTGNGNVALGYYALSNQSSTQNYNIGIGYESMYNSSGSGDSHNIGIGYRSLYQTYGVGNVGIGSFTGNSLQSGNYNVILGYRSGITNITGSQNIFIGYEVANFARTVSNNIAIGAQSGRALSGSDNLNIVLGVEALGFGGNVVSGNGNIAIGYQALYTISSSVGNDSLNTGIGYQALRGLTTGVRNVGIGYTAGFSIGAGSGNVFIGSRAGLSVRDRSSLVAIGTSALETAYSGSDNIGIGANALFSAGNTSSGAFLGQGNVGIGSNAGVAIKQGTYNIAIGYNAYTSNTGTPLGTGSYNVFIGVESAIIGVNNGDAGDYNTGIGYASFGRDGSGNYLRNPGPRNVGIGPFTFCRLSSSRTTRNTTIGSNSGQSLVLGSDNFYGGYLSGWLFATGSYNIFIGSNAASNIISGSNNTIIGSITNLPTSSNGVLAIGVSSSTRIQINNDDNGFISASLNITGSLLYLPNGIITSSILNVSHSLFSLSTSSYNAAFFDYMIVSASNAKSGLIMGVWTSGSITSSINSTGDIGDTSGVVFDLVISESRAQLKVITSTSGWNIKTIVRPI